MNQPVPIAVGIVDDNPGLIRTTHTSLSFFDQISVTFTALDGQEALDMLSKQQPDVVLMDIEMAVMDGITATARIHELYPAVKVIMLTVFDQDDKIFDAIMAGATGYLMKDEKPARLFEAICEAVDGGAPMSPKIARRALHLLRHLQQTEAPRQVPADFQLTRREIEMLEAIAAGQSYQAVADQMFVSLATVKKHIENIYRKMQVHNKVDAVKIAMKNKWFGG